MTAPFDVSHLLHRCVRALLALYNTTTRSIPSSPPPSVVVSFCHKASGTSSLPVNSARGLDTVAKASSKLLHITPIASCGGRKCVGRFVFTKPAASDSFPLHTSPLPCKFAFCASMPIQRVLTPRSVLRVFVYPPPFSWLRAKGNNREQYWQKESFLERKPVSWNIFMSNSAFCFLFCQPCHLFTTGNGFTLSRRRKVLEPRRRWRPQQLAVPFGDGHQQVALPPRLLVAPPQQRGTTG